MIKTAKERSYDILRSFKSDSTNQPNTCKIRANELSDSPSAKYKWFDGGNKLTTVSGRRRNRYYGIYENSFSKQKSLLDEPARISLSGSKRDD